MCCLLAWREVYVLRVTYGDVVAKMISQLLHYRQNRCTLRVYAYLQQGYIRKSTPPLQCYIREITCDGSVSTQQSTRILVYACCYQPRGEVEIAYTFSWTCVLCRQKQDVTTENARKFADGKSTKIGGTRQDLLVTDRDRETCERQWRNGAYR